MQYTKTKPGFYRMGHTSPACHVAPSCIVSSVALIRIAGRFTMVAIAQLVEHLIVVQEVARSSRVSHPTTNPYSQLVNHRFYTLSEFIPKPNV